MKAININPSKSQTKRVTNRADLKRSLWDASLSNHPVTFADPTKVIKACKIKSCDLKSGAKAYCLFIPVLGTYFQTGWYLV
jgi:hypothetical protein